MNRLFSIVATVILSAATLLTTAQERTISDDTKLKFDDVLELIDSRYVDEVDQEKLIDDAIRGMLKDLDPHSEYYDKEQYKKMNEPLKGNFEGIGIQFTIIRDTIAVVAPISGGPSEKLGIRSGDKIVKIEGESVAGIGITNRDVIDQLRGDKGTEVDVTIYRKGAKKLLEYTIVRDEIPIFSVDASYMLTPQTGYIKINRFAEKTMDEYNEAMDELEKEGMENLVLDLRGNTGGYLKTAIHLSDEFLDDKQLIVYTEGVSSAKREYFATDRGRFDEGKLVLLIDEGSASASEIVSGAVQDWDRGLIIGRRSFGKGLVQGPFRLRDNSVLKLTTAKYYTPTGRCIQRPYEGGEKAYRAENKRRFEHGEYFHADSIDFADSLKYYTPNNRVVYGGGGIMPDIFMPLDTTENSDYLTDLYSEGVLNQYINEYVDDHRKELKEKYPDFESFDSGFDITPELLEEFVAYAEENGVERDEEGLETSKNIIENRLKALVARAFWKTEGYYRIVNQQSTEIQKAIEVIADNTFEEMKIAHN